MWQCQGCHKSKFRDDCCWTFFTVCVFFVAVFSGACIMDGRVNIKWIRLLTSLWFTFFSQEKGLCVLVWVFLLLLFGFFSWCKDSQVLLPEFSRTLAQKKKKKKRGSIYVLKKTKQPASPIWTAAKAQPTSKISSIFLGPNNK